MSEWISVKDRLPEDEGDYICDIGDFHVMHILHFSNIHKMWNAFNDLSRKTAEKNEIKNVKYWMPLPEQ